MATTRCINIDWLEIFCNEGSIPKDAAFFANAGWNVKLREYGTPQYQQMFTLLAGKIPALEVRRLPYSVKEKGGIFHNGDCHIRLTNNTCYLPQPVTFLRQFLLDYNITLKSISRVDLCWDFQKFDNGTKPEELLQAICNNTIAKLHQPRLSIHGTSHWSYNDWNSAKWGSPSSMITTKLYNKTQELREGHAKPYIEQQWAAAGLDMTQPVWRAEISMNSAAKQIVRMEDGEIFYINLDSIDSREKCWLLFKRLASKYLDFRIVTKSREGNYIRKNRCEQLQLIDNNCEVYTAPKLTNTPVPTRTNKMLLAELRKIVYEEEHPRTQKDRAYWLEKYLASYWGLATPVQ